LTEKEGPLEKKGRDNKNARYRGAMKGHEEGKEGKNRGRKGRVTN